MEYFVTCNGIPVHVSDSGKGDRTFLLLHGYLETLYIWEEFRDLLPDSSRIVSIDLPGCGLSGTDSYINSMQFSAKVLLDLLDKLCIMRPVIIGHSMGGYVGQRFLRDYPGRLSALVNLNSVPYADDPAKASDREREISFIVNGKLVQLAQIVIPNMYAKANLRECDEKISETVEICEMHDPVGIAAVVRGLASRDDNVGLLSTPSVPVMFVFGDEDTYCSLERVDSIKKDLPGCTHAVIPGTGHNSFVEKPQEVASVIDKFLSKADC